MIDWTSSRENPVLKSVYDDKSKKKEKEEKWIRQYTKYVGRSLDHFFTLQKRFLRGREAGVPWYGNKLC